MGEREIKRERGGGEGVGEREGGGGREGEREDRVCLDLSELTTALCHVGEDHLHM